mmetsp:Transcript_6625/g.18074  ORF Transcript_6625/g.18074 Transcript_6625/m.18074 type:complete len:208 (+) Transcript_6625:1683-2306(+)
MPHRANAASARQSRLRCRSAGQSRLDRILELLLARLSLGSSTGKGRMVLAPKLRLLLPQLLLVRLRQLRSHLLGSLSNCLRQLGIHRFCTQRFGVRGAWLLCKLRTHTLCGLICSPCQLCLCCCGARCSEVRGVRLPGARDPCIAQCCRASGTRGGCQAQSLLDVRTTLRAGLQHVRWVLLTTAFQRPVHAERVRIFGSTCAQGTAS